MERLIVDARIVESERGAGALFRDLLPSICRAARKREITAEVVVSSPLQAEIVGTLDLPSVQLTGRGSFMHMTLPRHVRQHRGGVLLIPRQTRPLPPWVTTASIFLDIGFLDMPAAYPRHVVRDLTTRFAATRNAVNFAISEFTRDAMREYFGQGCSDIVALPIRARTALKWAPASEPYALCCAAAHPNKNLLRLIEAWRDARLPGVLVIVGAGGPLSEDVRTAAARANTDVRGFVSDAELIRLMQQCHLYIQPSLYEGLCFPVLDSLAAGVPVAASNTNQLGMLMQGVPQATFDPEDAGNIAATARRLWYDEGLRSEVAAYGQRTMTLTDWDSVGEAVLCGMERLT